MKKFPRLEHYPLEIVLQLKNKIEKQEAKNFSAFLTHTLIPQPEKRIQASDALRHEWFSREIPSEFKMYIV